MASPTTKSHCRNEPEIWWTRYGAMDESQTHSEQARLLRTLAGECEEGVIRDTFTRLAQRCEELGRQEKDTTGRSRDAVLSCPMAIYRMRSFGPTGRIVSVHKISAIGDEEAVSLAQEMVTGASGVATFDLWEGERRVRGAAPKTKPRRL